MRFSEVFEARPQRADDWFDAHLRVDTKRFVDPIFLYRETARSWAGAHEQLLAHFVRCYELVAEGGTSKSPKARMARTLLTFPEPVEFGLGYTASGTRGSGSGRRLAQTMSDGIAVAIAAGLTRPEHIEEIGFLVGTFCQISDYPWAQRCRCAPREPICELTVPYAVLDVSPLLIDVLPAP